MGASLTYGLVTSKVGIYIYLQRYAFAHILSRGIDQAFPRDPVQGHTRPMVDKVVGIFVGAMRFLNLIA